MAKTLALVCTALLTLASCATQRVSLGAPTLDGARWLKVAQSNRGCKNIYPVRPELYAVISAATPKDIVGVRKLIASDDFNGSLALELRGSIVNTFRNPVDVQFKIRKGLCVGWTAAELIVETMGANNSFKPNPLRYIK